MVALRSWALPLRLIFRLGMAAGAIIAAAYVSEIASPLTDGPVLCAAIADVSVFSLCKKFLPIVIAVCLVSVGLYFFIGSTLGNRHDGRQAREPS